MSDSRYVGQSAMLKSFTTEQKIPTEWFFCGESIGDCTGVTELESCKVQPGIIWISHGRKTRVRVTVIVPKFTAARSL